VSTVPLPLDGWWSRMLSSVCDALQRCPSVCAPAVLYGAWLRSRVRVGTGWVETAAERRCARTAPCIGNEIDRYHKALICRLSIYCYLLHTSTGLLLRTYITAKHLPKRKSRKIYHGRDSTSQGILQFTLAEINSQS